MYRLVGDLVFKGQAERMMCGPLSGSWVQAQKYAQVPDRRCDFGSMQIVLAAASPPARVPASLSSAACHGAWCINVRTGDSGT